MIPISESTPIDRRIFTSLAGVDFTIGRATTRARDLHWHESFTRGTDGKGTAQYFLRQVMKDIPAIMI